MKNSQYFLFLQRIFPIWRRQKKKKRIKCKLSKIPLNPRDELGLTITVYVGILSQRTIHFFKLKSFPNTRPKSTQCRGLQNEVIAI